MTVQTCSLTLKSASMHHTHAAQVASCRPGVGLGLGQAHLRSASRSLSTVSTSSICVLPSSCDGRREPSSSPSGESPRRPSATPSPRATCDPPGAATAAVADELASPGFSNLQGCGVSHEAGEHECWGAAPNRGEHDAPSKRAPAVVHGVHLVPEPASLRLRQGVLPLPACRSSCGRPAALPALDRLEDRRALRQLHAAQGEAQAVISPSSSRCCAPRWRSFCWCCAVICSCGCQH